MRKFLFISMLSIVLGAHFLTAAGVVRPVKPAPIPANKVQPTKLGVVRPAIQKKHPIPAHHKHHVAFQNKHHHDSRSLLPSDLRKYVGKLSKQAPKRLAVGKHRNDFCRDVKYVKGGECEPGDGSKKHPWNSLTQAQLDQTWKTLIVLSSPIALDGGIILQDGQSIVGEDSPLCAGNTHFPILTNTTADSNGGNAIVVSPGASVTIKNLWIRDPWASAIRYDDAVNLEISHALITGNNQGEVILPYPFAPFALVPFPDYYAAAIQGTSVNSGKTRLCKVVIRDSHVGSGLNEFVVQAANRSVCVDRVDISGLGIHSQSIPPTVEDAVMGIILTPLGIGARQEILVKNTFIHDFSDTSIAAFHYGVLTQGLHGASYNTLIEKSSFYNLLGSASIVVFHVFAFAQTDPSLVPNFPADRTTFTFTVRECVFEEPPENVTAPVQAINWDPANSVGQATIQDNIFINIFDSIIGFAIGNCENHSIVTGNNATGQDAFFQAVALADDSFGVPPNAIQTAVVTKNTFAGGALTGAIAVIPNLTGTLGNWVSLTIDATKNCFDGLGGQGFAGLIGLSLGPDDAGNATINAHFNNIVGFLFDIYDSAATATGTNFLAQNNWWGTPAGPQNLETGGAGTVITIPFLTSQITCPKTDLCLPPPPPVVVDIEKRLIRHDVHTRK